MHQLRTSLVLAIVIIAMTGCFGRKKYENPIDQDTVQPDKALFDKAIADMEKGRYRIARLTLQTLINTYDTSEYMAKAKLALADSWYREGGGNGFAQAEAEYKDFILFYPMMEEAAEAQSRVCMIHYNQMLKPDRDPVHPLRADEECRQLMIQFPNSKFVPEMEQKLRSIQEVIAEGEFRVGEFYFKKGSLPASTNRLNAVVEHYPLYSKSDQALWKLGEAWGKMGPRFQKQSIAAYQRIVRDYPLSPYAEQATRLLEDKEQEVPEPDPVALARMEYEQENYKKPSRLATVLGVFRGGPTGTINRSAKSGNPATTYLRPTIPVSVPGQLGAAGGMTADVTVSGISTDSSALDKKPDARRVQPKKPKQ